MKVVIFATKVLSFSSKNVEEDNFNCTRMKHYLNQIGLVWLAHHRVGPRCVL